MNDEDQYYLEAEMIYNAYLPNNMKPATEVLNDLFAKMAHDLYDQSKDDSPTLTYEKFLGE